MAVFQFPLEPVLAYKKSLVELLQAELARLQQQAEEARAVRDALIERIQQNRANLRALLEQGHLDLEMVVWHEGFLEALSKQLAQQEVIVAELEARVAAKREELLKVQQEEAMLETLKQRQLEQFRYELERAEGQLIDESAIAGFNRRHMGTE